VDQNSSKDSKYKKAHKEAAKAYHKKHPKKKRSAQCPLYLAAKASIFFLTNTI